MKTIRNIAATGLFAVLMTVGMPSPTVQARFCHIVYNDPDGFTFDQCDQSCPTMSGVCESHCGGPYDFKCYVPEFPTEGECECGGA